MTTRSPGLGGPPSADPDVFGPLTGLRALQAELATLPVGPRPDFRNELRRRLLDEAHIHVPEQAPALVGESPAAARVLPFTRSPTTPAETAAPRRTAPRRTAPQGRTRSGARRVAAVASAVSLLVGGVDVAAARTQPGNLLDPVKRVTDFLRHGGVVGHAPDRSLPGASPATDAGFGSTADLELIDQRLTRAEELAGAAGPTFPTAAFQQAMTQLSGAIAAGGTTGSLAVFEPYRIRLEALSAQVPVAVRGWVQHALSELIGGTAPSVPPRVTTPAPPASGQGAALPGAGPVAPVSEPSERPLAGTGPAATSGRPSSGTSPRSPGGTASRSTTASAAAGGPSSVPTLPVGGPAAEASPRTSADAGRALPRADGLATPGTGLRDVLRRPSSPARG